MRFVLLIFVILISTGITAAQKTTDDDPVEITSDDFGRTRDITKLIKAGDTVFSFPKPSFRLKKKTTRANELASRRKSGPKPGPQTALNLPTDTKGQQGWEKIGVTLWRLSADAKPAPEEKETARLLTQESGASREYTPQRAAADTIFNRGDKVRLSIESPRKGYLYVIDREIRADGSLGDPYQIFPTLLSRGGDNRVEPGQVIDIPSQSDRASHFTLASPDPNWRGELLTIIVSDTPLTGMTTLEKPSPISASMVDAMEDKYLRDTTEYEQQGTEGKSYTKTEKAAGSDGKRQLTQTDPFPQTVYRTLVRPNEPMLINLSLSVGNPK